MTSTILLPEDKFVKLDVNLIKFLVEIGGPSPEHYESLTNWFARCHAIASAEQISEKEADQIRAIFADALSLETIQGFVLNKPHGYAGDFEVIDAIYQEKTSQNASLTKWDIYFQNTHGAKAVRNRKKYFHFLLDELNQKNSNGKVLKIAIGPGRSMYEWLNKNSNSTFTFDCVDIDANAIAYAKALNAPFLNQINFIHKNALRYKPKDKYDLIWSAGLFDYFEDKTFIRLIERLLPSLNAGGELVIGNFSDINPSRPYMEAIGKWMLFHRSSKRLVELATKAGVGRERIRIDCEPTGVNLFMHIISDKSH